MEGAPDGALADPLGDLAMRVRLGASPGTPAIALTMLARDPLVTVRATVALNAASPLTVDQFLARDPDERVRMALTHKLLAARPDLSIADRQRLSEQAIAVLSLLVKDEAVRIRILIAEVLAGLPDIPHGLILALAHDSAIPVSEPVLRLSPLLSATDLLALLRDPPHPAASHAIARRANLPEAAADIIAASADSSAIRALLANPSASIRENTLESLIARARDHPDWQRPLVRRPVLPPHAARMLSEVIASHWLQELTERPDFPRELKSELKQRLWARLASEQPPGSTVADEAMMHAALQLAKHGQLDETAVRDALHAGDLRRVTALLAVAAGVQFDVVNRAAAMRSAKALTSLVWKAGFSMQTAIPVQALLGRLDPTEILIERDSGFPLNTAEMGWQLDLLTHGAR